MSESPQCRGKTMTRFLLRKKSRRKIQMNLVLITRTRLFLAIFGFIRVRGQRKDPPKPHHQAHQNVIHSPTHHQLIIRGYQKASRRAQQQLCSRANLGRRTNLLEENCEDEAPCSTAVHRSKWSKFHDESTKMQRFGDSE